MVKLPPNDPLARWSVLRCPRAKDCPVRYCPLAPWMDPGPLDPDEGFCYWWTLAGSIEAIDQVPRFLWRPLLHYTLRLIEEGTVTIDGIRIPRRGPRGSPETRLFPQGNGYV